MDNEKNPNSLVDFLIEKGALAAVCIAVATNIFVLLIEVFGSPNNPDAWRLYAAAITTGIFSFFLVLIFVYIKRDKLAKDYIFHAQAEEDHFEIQEQETDKIRIICRQRILIRATDNRPTFRLFNPLEDYIPTKFEFPNGLPETLEKKELKSNPDGVSISFSNRHFMKGIREEISAIWIYENSPRKNVLATTIHRPTTNFELTVMLPVNNPKPQEYGWAMHNIERYPIKAGKAKCKEYGGRYCVSQNFKRANEGFIYEIWWK